MKQAELSEQRLLELIDRFSECRVAVLGDFFLDKYLDIDPALQETSVETGKAAHQVAAIRCGPGAAGTVVNNLAALGAGQLHAIGLTGDDGEAFDLRRSLQAIDCTTDRLICSPALRTPTYLKPRNMSVAGLAGELTRYDTKNREVTPAKPQDEIIKAFSALLPKIDALIVLDQVEETDCGVVTTAVREAVIEAAQRNSRVIFWVDSRDRLDKFRHVMIKSNHFEAVGLRQPPPGTTVDEAQLLSAAERLRETNEAPIAVTCGPRGVLVSDPEWAWVPGVRLDGETDTTGAGDSFNAGAVLALSAGSSFDEAALVANLVASIAIEHLGATGFARPGQLPERLRLWQQQQKDLQNE